MINISVIIPTYNRPDETKRCLELFLKSEGLNNKFSAEIVVVDSSSDTSCGDKLKELGELEINYIHLDKQTLPGEARNIAIKEAKNELIFSLDSDIEVKGDTVIRMINYFQEHPSVAKLTGTTIFSGGEKKGEVDRPTKWDRTYENNKTVLVEGIYGRYEMFYRSVFLQIGGYDKLFGACGEGTDMSIRLWRAGYPLAIDKDIVAYHNSEAPASLRRVATDRMTAMYRSLMLVAYKCSVADEKESTNFIQSHKERLDAYGDTIEFHSIVAAANSIEWFAENIEEIKKSKNKISQEYDFKPFDIFTDEALIESCLDKAKERLADPFKRTFGK